MALLARITRRTGPSRWRARLAREKVHHAMSVRACSVAHAARRQRGARRQQRMRREPAAWLHNLAARGAQAPGVRRSARGASTQKIHHAVCAGTCSSVAAAARRRRSARRQQRTRKEPAAWLHQLAARGAQARAVGAQGEHASKAHHAMCARAGSVAHAARRHRVARRLQRAAQEPAAWLHKLAAQGAQVPASGAAGAKRASEIGAVCARAYVTANVARRRRGARLQPPAAARAPEASGKAAQARGTSEAPRREPLGARGEHAKKGRHAVSA